MNGYDTAAQQSNADEVIINVAAGAVPVADAGPDQNAGTSQSVQLDASNSSDSDGTIITYLWTQSPSSTVVISDVNISQPSFTSPDVEGSLIFMLTVTDDDGLSDDDEVIINVGSDPIAICDAGPNQDVNEFTTINELTSVVLDASNSTISSGIIASYLWTQISGENVTLAAPGQVTTGFVVNEVDAMGSSLTFEVTCTSDLGAQSKDEVIINVVDTNRAPISNAGSSQQIVEGDTVMLDGSQSSDIDGDAITFLWSLLSSSNGTGITLDSTTSATPQFIAPDVDDVTGESFTFMLTVSDDGNLSHSSEVIIHIAGTDMLPVADAGADQTVNEGVSVSLSGVNSSDDQGSLSYQWSQLSGAQISIANSNQVQATFTAPSVVGGSISLVFELTVTDSGSNIASDQITVTVNAVNNGGDGGSSGGGGMFILLGLLCGLMVISKRKLLL